MQLWVPMLGVILKQPIWGLTIWVSYYCSFWVNCFLDAGQHSGLVCTITQYPNIQVVLPRSWVRSIHTIAWTLIATYVSQSSRICHWKWRKTLLVLSSCEARRQPARLTTYRMNILVLVHVCSLVSWPSEVSVLMLQWYSNVQCSCVIVASCGVFLCHCGKLKHTLIIPLDESHYACCPFTIGSLVSLTHLWGWMITQLRGIIEQDMLVFFFQLWPVKYATHAQLSVHGLLGVETVFLGRDCKVVHTQST